MDEKEIRKNLENQLGVEFCSEEELETERVVAEKEVAVEKNDSEKKIAQTQISVTDIINACNDAGSKMSMKNPHKALFYLCASALRQLVNRLEKFENPKKVN